MSLFKRLKLCSLVLGCMLVQSHRWFHYNELLSPMVRHVCRANKSQWRERDKPAKAAFLIPYHRSRLIGNSRARWQSRLCSSILWLIGNVEDSGANSSMRLYRRRYPDRVPLNCFARQFSVSAISFGGCRWGGGGKTKARQVYSR